MERFITHDLVHDFPKETRVEEGDPIARIAGDEGIPTIAHTETPEQKRGFRVPDQAKLVEWTSRPDRIRFRGIQQDGRMTRVSPQSYPWRCIGKLVVRWSNDRCTVPPII